jgi:hypothetical protein
MSALNCLQQHTCIVPSEPMLCGASLSPPWENLKGFPVIIQVDCVWKLEERDLNDDTMNPVSMFQALMRSSAALIEYLFANIRLNPF